MRYGLMTTVPCAPALASAQSVEPATPTGTSANRQGDLAVTIYASNSALILDTRQSSCAALRGLTVRRGGDAGHRREQHAHARRGSRLAPPAQT